MNPTDIQLSEAILQSFQCSDDIGLGTDLRFSDLPLPAAMFTSLLELGWLEPTPVQIETIPRIMNGENLVARAKPGTGKTAAFLIPVLQMIKPEDDFTQALILVATRELAIQLHGVCIALTKYMSTIKVSLKIGNFEANTAVSNVKHIIISTPAHIYQQIIQGAVYLSDCGILVLDDAHLMAKGEMRGLNFEIRAYVAEVCQVLAFTASMSPHLSSMLKEFTPNGWTITIPHQVDSLNLVNVYQYYALLEESEKLYCLLEVLEQTYIRQVIIFCKSPYQVTLLTDSLLERGIQCKGMTGILTTNMRYAVMNEFTSGTLRTIVATDVLAYGLDVAAVNVVINYDIPPITDVFFYRAGRCGRFGTQGTVVNFATPHDVHDMLYYKDELHIDIYNMPNPLTPFWNILPSQENTFENLE